MKHIAQEVNMGNNMMLIHGEFTGHVEVALPEYKMTPEKWANFLYSNHRHFENRKLALKKAKEELEKTIRCLR